MDKDLIKKISASRRGRQMPQRGSIRGRLNVTTGFGNNMISELGVSNVRKVVLKDAKFREIEK